MKALFIISIFLFSTLVSAGWRDINMDSSLKLPSPNSSSVPAGTGRQIGVSYSNLTVYGFGCATDYQKTLANYPLAYLHTLCSFLGRRASKQSQISILRDFEGLVRSGEMLLVLGRPGSGCSTLLKTLVGQTHGLRIDKEAKINYQGKQFVYFS